jgi:dCMP deaminase
MKELKFMRFAEAAASLSKDPSTKVGAVVIDDQYTILATGYNGFARGVTDSEERLCDRPMKLRLTVHAESNTLLAAARTGRKLDGATMIVSSLFPCEACASAIVQAGIKRVIAPKIDEGRWKESNEMAKLIFAEAGVEVVEI